MKAKPNRISRIISRKTITTSPPKYVVQQINWIGMWRDVTYNRNGNSFTVEFSKFERAKKYVMDLFSMGTPLVEENVIEEFDPTNKNYD